MLNATLGDEKTLYGLHDLSGAFSACGLPRYEVR